MAMPYSLGLQGDLRLANLYLGEAQGSRYLNATAIFGPSRRRENDCDTESEDTAVSSEYPFGPCHDASAGQRAIDLPGATSATFLRFVGIFGPGRSHVGARAPKPGRSHRALSGRLGGATSFRRNISRPDRCCQRLDAAEQESDGQRAGAGRQWPVVGPER